MTLISPIRVDLARKLLNRAFRTRFFRKRAQDEIALQIRELRTKRKMKQADLAKLCSMKQSAVSRIEQSEYSAWNFKTLLRVAEALDARLRVTLEPMENVVREYQDREKNVVTTEISQVLHFAKIQEAQGANVTTLAAANDFLRPLTSVVVTYSDEKESVRIPALPPAHNKEFDPLLRAVSNF
ncbi:MAG: helix-turn-helix domain-containing protein [Nitrospiraceae bacterium]